MIKKNIEIQSNPSPIDASHLSIFEAACLLGLLRTRYQWAPFAPNKRMSLEVLNKLQNSQLIKLPWPAMSWSSSDSGFCTPLEQFGWKYSWDAYKEDEVEQILINLLSEKKWTKDSADERIQLWESLCFAEVHSFAERQLEKHSFEIKWADDLDWVITSKWKFSIANWRYVIWAAIRKGASEYLKTGGATDIVRRGIHSEYIKRAELIRKSKSYYSGMPPKGEKPYSVIGQVFVELVIPLKFDYWNLNPSLWAEQRNNTDK